MARGWRGRWGGRTCSSVCHRCLSLRPAGRLSLSLNADGWLARLATSSSSSSISSSREPRNLGLPRSISANPSHLITPALKVRSSSMLHCQSYICALQAIPRLSWAHDGSCGSGQLEPNSCGGSGCSPPSRASCACSRFLAHQTRHDQTRPEHIRPDTMASQTGQGRARPGQASAAQGTG